VQLRAQVRALVKYNSMGQWGWLDLSPVKDNAQVILGDIRDSDCMRAATEGIDVLYHLAALIGIPYSYEAPLSYVRTNVEGTLNVLRAAQEAGVEKVIHTSTSEVYGTARYVPIDEKHPLQAQSPYSATKIAADKLAESFHLSYGLPVVTVRPFNVFGPRQSARAVIPAIIIQVLADGPVRLGSLSPARDYTYVEDTVAGFVLAVEADAAVGRVINLGSGQEVSVGGLAKMILQEIGGDREIVSDERRVRPPHSEVERLVANNRLAKELLGWEPQHSLEEGLRLTVEWVKDNMERYRPDVYAV
jgi:dTDP-glucose 4,6-dehydratase